MDELVLFEASKALSKSVRTHYEITNPMTGNAVQLKRDVDFGVIKGTKKPTLFKSGAEKIAMAYGLMQRFTIESKIEQAGDDPFFFYNVRCDLVKINPANGLEYIFTSGYGSANTKEKRNGFSAAFDVANSTLKMAQKRSLVAAAVSVSGLSDMFTQDMDNEDFMNSSKELVDTASDDAPVTAKQVKRLYAIADDAGMNANEMKNKLAAKGYVSTKDIKQKDYESICEWIRSGAEEEKK